MREQKPPSQQKIDGMFRSIESDILKFEKDKLLLRRLKMNDRITGLIRTVVPSLVGALVAWFTALGIELDAEAIAAITVALTGLFTGIYWWLVRKLSTKWPKLEWLLGSAKTPTYK